MNNTFEEQINQIIVIMNKRLNIAFVLSIAMSIVTIILILLKMPYTILLILSGTLFLLPLYYGKQVTRLKSLIDTYQTHQQDVLDYLTIVMHQNDLAQNFILRLHYKKIIPFYEVAYLSLKEQTDDSKSNS